MVGWETLSDAIATDADQFGGAYLNRVTQLLIGADIAASDLTLAPVIGTNWTFKSGKLFLTDVAGTHTVNLIPDTQSVNTVLKTPAQSITPDYISLREQSETLKNKVLSGAFNTFSLIPDTALSANVILLATAQTVSSLKTYLTNVFGLRNPANTFTTTLNSGAIAGAITITLPTIADTLVGKITTDTLTNKTLTSPIISTIVNTGTLTLPTVTDTLIGRLTTDTLTNKSISGATNTFTLIPDAALSANVDLLGTPQTASALETFLTACLGLRNPANTFTTTLNSGAIAGAITITLPTIADTLVGKTTTDILTNKTLSGPSITDATDIVLGTTTGTKFGTGTTQKIGFYGKAPVVQAVAITTPTSDTVGTKVAIDAIRVALTNLGLTA
jgi:hypothetical protein